MSEHKGADLVTLTYRRVLDCVCRGDGLSACPNVVTMSAGTYEALCAVPGVLPYVGHNLSMAPPPPATSRLLGHRVVIDDAAPFGEVAFGAPPDAPSGATAAPFPEMIAPGAFRTSVGRTLRVEVNGVTIGHAVVEDDGEGGIVVRSIGGES